MQDVIAYFSTHGTDYIQMVLEHLNVSILSLAAAILIAVPLGIACSRSPLLEKISVGVSGILRIIPSLAVLVVCVPILGTGVLPKIGPQSSGAACSARCPLLFGRPTALRNLAHRLPLTEV